MDEEFSEKKHSIESVFVCIEPTEIKKEETENVISSTELDLLATPSTDLTSLEISSNSNKEAQNSIKKEKTDNGGEKNAQKRLQTDMDNGNGKKPRTDAPELPSEGVLKGGYEVEYSDDVEEYYLTIYNFPNDWSYVQIKNYLDRQCGHVDEMEMINQGNSKNCAIRLTFPSSEKCKEAHKKLKDKVVEDKILELEITEPLTSFPPPPNINKQQLDSSTTDVSNWQWRPDQDMWATDPNGLYGLRPQFLKSLDISPPVDRWVHVTNKQQKRATERAKATSAQLNHLIEFMKQNPNCSSGRGSGVGLEGKIIFEKQWRKLVATLNSLGGPVKSIDRWKQTWRDVRNSMKKKAIQNKEELKRDSPGDTGKVPAQLNVSNAQDKVSQSVKKPVSVYRIEGVPCTMPPEVQKEASSTQPTAVPITVGTPVTSQLSMPCPALTAVPETVIEVEVIPPSPSPSLSPSPLLPQATTKPRLRRRRRVITTPENFDGQILKFEKARLELQKRQIIMGEEKLKLKEKHLLIEEKKVKALERIAAALETHNI